jgi:hypothetical protein
MTPKAPPIWTKDAAEFVRSFLQSPVGQVAVMHLLAQRPAINAGEAGNDLNKAALSGQFAAGYEEAVQSLLRLSEWTDSQATRVVDNYPDPEDDGQFEDGNSLEKARQEAEKHRLK